MLPVTISSSLVWRATLLVFEPDVLDVLPDTAASGVITVVED